MKKQITESDKASNKNEAVLWIHRIDASRIAAAILQRCTTASRHLPRILLRLAAILAIIQNDLDNFFVLLNTFLAHAP